MVVHALIKHPIHKYVLIQGDRHRTNYWTGFPASANSNKDVHESDFANSRPIHFFIYVFTYYKLLI